MKRPWLILLGGLVLAALAYGGAYYAGSVKTCCLMESKSPELAWLQKEFHLSDTEFSRIEKLHESYLAGCADRCQLIDAKNAEVRALLATNTAATPEIEAALHEAAQLRADCQKAMLNHFYEIRATMPPEQGQRYFDWVVGCTFGSEHDTMTHASAGAAHEHDHE